MYLTTKQADDADLIKELASQALSVSVSDVRPMGGCVSYNYEINHKSILKLPGRRTVPQRWIDQSIYLPRLQEQLPYQIPTLKASVLHLPSGEDIIACSYPKIQGHTFSKDTFHQRPLAQKILFFEQLSQAVSQLHATPVKAVPHQFATYLDYAAQFLFKTSQEKQDMFKQRIQGVFQKKNISFRNTLLCHTDLHPGNIVLENKTKLVGIVDWDSLCLGDNFLEFHPPLYKDKDLQLFCEIYTKTTHQPVNQKAVSCLSDLQKKILFLCAFDAKTKQVSKPTNETKKQTDALSYAKPNLTPSTGRC